jgi:DNA-directed RNA polymerase sigma subunit (sigma70/sigma32)
MTLKEIGKKFGLTRERIRQLRREALTKLYEYMNEQ